MNFNEFLNEKYTKDDINTMYGFYGAMEDEHNEKIADEIFDAAVKDIMKEFGLKDIEAVSLLNSKAGRQAADAMIAGECEDSVVAGMYWYFGKNKAKIINFAKKTVSESNELDEAKYPHGAPLGLTKAKTKKVAETLAKAMSKYENAKVTVNLKTLEEDSFDLDYDGEEYAGGSFNIYDDGSVVNHAITPNEIYGTSDSSVDDFIKGLKKPIKESLEINEAKALPLDKLTKMIGDKPSCYDLADFIYTNYDKVTGLRKSMRNDEMDFPMEIEDLVNHYGFDMDDLSLIHI